MAKTEKALFSLDEATLDRLRLRAAFERRPKSAIVRDALGAYFDLNAFDDKERERLENLLRGSKAVPKVLSLQSVLSALRALREQIQKRGVAHLAVFGSVAREEATPASDIDVLIDVAPEMRFSLFDLAYVQDLIEQRCKRNVDVVLRSSLYPHVEANALREAINVF